MVLYTGFVLHCILTIKKFQPKATVVVTFGNPHLFLVQPVIGFSYDKIFLIIGKLSSPLSLKQFFFFQKNPQLGTQQDQHQDHSDHNKEVNVVSFEDP